jgi:hypothetical protein
MTQLNITADMRKALRSLRSRAASDTLTPEVFERLTNELWDLVGTAESYLQHATIIDPPEEEFEVTVAGIQYAGAAAEAARRARQFRVIDGGRTQ